MSKSPKEDTKQEPTPQGVGDPGDSANGGDVLEAPGNTSEESATSRPVDSVFKEALAQEMAKLREELNNTYAEENRLLKERIKQLEEDKGSPIIEEVGKIREEVETLRSKLPRTVRDERAKIEGYYDFDSAARKYVNENTNKELNRARSEFKILGA